MASLLVTLITPAIDEVGRPTIKIAAKTAAVGFFVPCLSIWASCTDAKTRQLVREKSASSETISMRSPDRRLTRRKPAPASVRIETEGLSGLRIFEAGCRL
jgi:hypothetical protein